MGATGAVRRQRWRAQRARRWSKALRSRLRESGEKGREGKPGGDTGRAVGGGNASKGGTVWRGSRFRDRRKRCEPQDRQRDETSPRSRRGASRRGGAKPRGRNAGGCGNPPRRTRKRSGADSSACVDGGAIFGQTQERKPGEETRRVARTGRCRERRHEGQEGRANSITSGRSPPIEGPSRAGVAGASKGAEAAPRPRRALAKANEPELRSDPSPAGATHRAGRRARTL
jgi:hypothetical protein